MNSPLLICTGCPLSESLIFASINPKYDDRLFVELRVEYNLSSYFGLVDKGEIISKGFLMSSISSKKRTKEFDFTTMIPQVDLFSFVFWRKSRTPKNHFEIVFDVFDFLQKMNEQIPLYYYDTSS